MATTLSEADDGESLPLKVGDCVTLRLHENASTGYRWVFDGFDANAIDAREDGYAAGAGSVGSGGDVQWTLQAKSAGTAHVKLKLWRAWEGEASVRKRFAVTLMIRP
jgi:inhibitor of cysteine peptidase